MAKAKGAPKTGGRVKGTPNRLTADLKDMILGALDKVGGLEYLAQQAVDNPGAFMTLVGKVLPLQVTGKDGTPLAVPVLNVVIGGNQSPTPPEAGGSASNKRD